MTHRRIRALAAAALVGAAFFALPQLAQGTTIELGVGEWKSVGDQGLIVGFEYIKHDSRCPSDALCFWEGDAVALIGADHPEEEKTIVELHTFSDFKRGFVFNGYYIALKKVTPYPRTDIIIDPDDYVVALTISVSKTPVETTTWSRIKALYNPTR